MRYNNFLSFLVQSKAITPLAETTLKRVTFTTWSHNEADPDDRPRGKEAHAVRTARSVSGRPGRPRPGQDDRQRPQGGQSLAF